MAGAAQGTVGLTVVPTSGKPTSYPIPWSDKGTLGDTLKAAGIATDNRDFKVNGKPADLNAELKADDKVQVAERPRGS